MNTTNTTDSERILHLENTVKVLENRIKILESKLSKEQGTKNRHISNREINKYYDHDGSPISRSYVPYDA